MISLRSGPGSASTPRSHSKQSDPSREDARSDKMPRPKRARAMMSFPTNGTRMMSWKRGQLILDDEEITESKVSVKAANQVDNVEHQGKSEQRGAQGGPAAPAR